MLWPPASAAESQAGCLPRPVQVLPAASRYRMGGLLDFAPEACVYLDDLGINCKPAAALGMTAIKVSSEDQLLSDLAKATGLAF